MRGEEGDQPWSRRPDARCRGHGDAVARSTARGRAQEQAVDPRRQLHVVDGPRHDVIRARVEERDALIDRIGLGERQDRDRDQSRVRLQARHDLRRVDIRGAVHDDQAGARGEVQRIRPEGRRNDPAAQARDGARQARGLAAFGAQEQEGSLGGFHCGYASRR